MNPINPQTVIDLTQKLVQLPSEAGQERLVAQFLLDTLPAYGFDPVLMDDYGSVTGIRRGEHPGPTVLLDAHTDTVGVAPGVPWNHDPYSGTVVGDRLFGRGTSDMKGALAAMIVAAGAVNPADLAGQLVLSASVLEEVLEGAALQHIMKKHCPDFVIIGEASDLKIVHGGRGRAELLIETIGIPAHSSSPESGVNAVEAMIRLLTSMQAFELPRHPFVGQAILALTDIISEPYPGHSVIPSRCRATIDRRLIPGETPDEVLDPLRRVPMLPGAKLNVGVAQGKYAAFTGRLVKQKKWFPAWMLEKDHLLVQRAVHSLEKIGLPPAFSAYNFCTNAAYSAGEARVPTIGFGPSHEEMAHIVDEYIEIDSLINAAHAYKAMIEGLLSA
jgi:putative selenium metabolism hydrolase